MTTWNAADKDAGVTLSGGDLVASPSPNGGVRATTSKSSGKNSYSISGDLSADDIIAGVSVAGADRAFGDANGFGASYLTGFGWAVINAGSVVAGPDVASPAPTGTDTLVVHIDSSANLVYFTCNGNNLLGGNPAAGTGGISISSGPHYPNVVVGSGPATESATADFTPGSLPSGFSDWDGGGSPYSVAANGGTYSLTGASVVTAIKPDWTFVGKSDVAVDASGNYTLSEPTGAQQDDILVVDIAIRSNVLHTNADWTFPQSDSSGNTTNNTTGSIVSYQTGYCIRGSSAPSYVFAKTGGSRCLATVRAYRSSRAGTPVFDTSAEVAMGAASGTVTLTGGVTTAEPGELLVTGVFGARANTVSNMDGTTEVTGNSGSTDTTTPPTRGTWIERSDRNNGTSPTVALACYDTIKPTAGSTGNLTATESQSARHGMTVMAFKHPPSSSNKTIAADGGSYALTGATVATKLGRKVAATGGSYALTGSAVTLRRNLPVVVGSGSYSLTGASVTLREARKVSALGGTYALTGAAVTVRHGYTVSVAAGSYALTGAAVPLLKTWRLDATGGSYALSGSAVTLRYGYAVGAGSGSYAISGASVALRHGYAVSVGGGSYALNGTSVPLLKKWRLDATSGTYALTGADVTLTKSSSTAYSVAADSGSYSLNGSSVSLLHAWKLSAASGSYALTGSSVTLRANKAAVAGSGTYSISGSAVSLLHGWKVAASTGSYAITGSAVSLVHNYSVSAAAGSYAITGASVDLTYTSTLRVNADSGSYSLSGSSVSLLMTWSVAASSGSYLISGSDVSVAFGVAPGTWAPIDSEAEQWTRSGNASSTWTEVTASQETWTRKGSASSSWMDDTSSPETWTRIN